MDINKKINIDFSDNGSLKKLQDLFGRMFVGSDAFERLLGPPGVGGNTTGGTAGRLRGLQSQFLRESESFNNAYLESLERTRNKINQKLREFEQYDRQVSSFRGRESSYLEKQREFDDQFGQYKTQDPLRYSTLRRQAGLESWELKIQEERDRLPSEPSLSGTGFRKRHTFEQGSDRALNKAAREYELMVSKQEKTNQLLQELLTQDKKLAEEQVKTWETKENASESEREAARLYREAEEPERKQRRDTLLSAAMSIVGPAASMGVQQYSIWNNWNYRTRMATGTFDGIRAEGDYQAQTQKNLWSGGGAVVGGIIGTLIAPGIGTAIGLGIGQYLGGFIGEGSSAAEKLKNDSWVRHLEYGEDLRKTGNRFSALTGRDYNVGNDSVRQSYQDMGFKSVEYLQMLQDVSRARGDSRGSERDSLLTMGYSKGWGVDQGVTMELMNLLRSSRTEDRDIQNVISGVWERGQEIFKGDRTYLAEFLQTKFIPLQRELLKNQSSISSGTTMDILSRWGGLGGQFDSKHQNSQGLLMGINNALINPGSDSLNAISFLSLRESNPGMGLLDTLKERQKGLGSQSYVSSMLSMIDRMGGDDDMKTLQLAGMLGLEGNLDAASSIYNQRDKIMSGKVNASDLVSSQSPLVDGSKYTTQEEKFQADIYHLILTNYQKAGDIMVERMKKMADAINDPKPRLQIDINGNVISTQFDRNDGVIDAEIKQNRVRENQNTRQQYREDVAAGRVLLGQNKL